MPEVRLKKHTRSFCLTKKRAVYVCDARITLQEKHYGSQTVRLTDEGWQKAVPKQIELWDISSLDSLNKQRACGGHRGQGSGQWGLAQYPGEGRGGKERMVWGAGSAPGVVVSP